MKKILIFLLMMILFTSTTIAQQVTVEGYGANKNEALKNAEKEAVEQVVGALINSQTLIEGCMLKLQEIYSASHGFVNNVKILSEGKTSDGRYMVKAQMNVESEANTNLISQLEAVMRLNDPRITIIMLKDNASAGTHDELSESAFNEKLMELGFSHILDANIVSSLKNSQLLSKLYNGEKGIVSGDNDSVDYLVIGVTHTSADSIKIPNYGASGGYINHPMNRGTADITAKIIKLATGDIVGTFSVRGIGNDISADSASRTAIRTASITAATELEKRFKKLAMTVRHNSKSVW